MKISRIHFKFMIVFFLLSLGVLHAQEKRIIAIIPFENKGTSRFDWVKRGIEEILYDKFANINELTIYEKETLNRNLKKLNIKTSADISRRNAFTLGKFTGVEIIVAGDYQVKSGVLTTNFRLISTYTGSDIFNRQYSGNLGDIFSLYTQAIMEALDILQVPLSAEEQEILEEKPTRSLRAFEYYCKAYVEMARGSTMETIAGYFQRAIQEDPDYWEAQYNLGVIYYNFDIYDKALRQFDLVISRNPQFFKPYFGKGVIYYLQRKYRAALREFKKAVARNPEYDRIYYYRGLVYLKMDSIPQAIASFEKEIELNPNYAPAYYRLGQANIKRGWYRKAIVNLNQAIKLNENSARAHNALGEAYYALNMFEEAIIEFKKAIQLRPRYATAYFNIANAVYKKGALEEIVEAFWQILEGQYLKNPLQTQQTTGGLPLEEFQKVRKEASSASDPTEIHRKMIRNYRKAISYDSRFYEAAYNLALTYENIGVLDSARFFYEKAIRINPSLAQAHMRLAKLYEKDKDYAAALEQYKKVVAIDPTYFIYNPRLGEDYRYINIVEVVLNEYQEKLTRNPKDPNALRVVGRIFYSLGRFGQAEEYFQQLVQLNPADQTARKTLREIKKKLRKL